MGASITIRYETNMVELVAFVRQDEIWANISDKLEYSSSFIPRHTPEAAWLSVWINGKRVGVIFLHHEGSYTLKVHPYFLKSVMIYCRDIMKSFFAWFLMEIDEQIIKITALVDITKKSVHNFAKNVGFVQEGVNRASLKKGDQIVDQIYFGITRDEIKEVVRL